MDPSKWKIYNEKVPKDWKLIISDYEIEKCVQKLARVVDENYNLSVLKKEVLTR